MTSVLTILLAFFLASVPGPDRDYQPDRCPITVDEPRQCPLFPPRRALL